MEKLRVQKGDIHDVGQNIARISERAARNLNVQVNDILEIRGKRTTVAKIRIHNSKDDEIWLDGVQRENASASIGEFVECKRIDNIHDAEEVGIKIEGDTDIKEIQPQLIGKPAMSGDRVLIEIGRSLFLPSESAKRILLTITETKPGGVVVLNARTKISSKQVKSDKRNIPKIRYEDIGGMDAEVQKVREIVELPLRNPELFKRLGVDPPAGILLLGPPGTGKTLLAKVVANETNAHFELINAAEIKDKLVGGSEEKLRNIFKRARENLPAIIFIDEIDAIAPKRSESSGVERGIVNQLLTLMDGVEEKGRLIVFGITNTPNDLDPALRRPGRFDREIKIGVPNRKGRREILQIHSKNMPLKDVDLDEIARITHGFVGADLMALCKEAGMCVGRNNAGTIYMHDKIPDNVLNELFVTQKDFENALTEVSPSAIRGYIVEIPDIKFDDIGGYSKEKEFLIKEVIEPFKDPTKYNAMGIEPAKGCILYGPPGTGKTLFAKALANEAECNFILINGPELKSMFVGKGEESIRELFETARQMAPCTIFFDEFDSIAGSRENRMTSESLVEQLLVEIDGVKELKNVFLLAATNRIDLIDSALLRPGRFGVHIEIGNPDYDARLKILKVHTKNKPLEDVNIEEIAEKTAGFTGASLKELCTKSAKLVLKENNEPGSIQQKHFIQSLNEIKGGNEK